MLPAIIVQQATARWDCGYVLVQDPSWKERGDTTSSREEGALTRSRLRWEESSTKRKLQEPHCGGYQCVQEPSSREEYRLASHKRVETEVPTLKCH